MVSVSCDDVFEDDLSGETINILAPANNAINPFYMQTFWWDYVDDATTYQLQLVRPSFDSVLVLYLDTNISINKFQISLSPGLYEWRVRALNGSSSTRYFARKFEVISSGITGQTILTTVPTNDTYTNINMVLFSWQSLFGATRYRIQIDSLNFIDESKLVLNNLSLVTSLNYEFNKDGNYKWRVRAENDTAISNWSTVNGINIDRTPPNQVMLVSPANNALLNSPINFSWQAISGVANYKLYVYKADSVTLYNSSYPQSHLSNSAIFSGLISNEKIVWQVSAVDRAGNEGLKSVKRGVTIL